MEKILIKDDKDFIDWKKISSRKQWRNNMKKMYIARDKSGALHIFREKPTFRYERWWGKDTIYECEIDASQYPEVTFENSPMEVELKLIEK